jgi:L-ribulokinase
MFTLGIDFGTNSVRALIVRCEDGAEFGGAVADYPTGLQGVLLTAVDHHLARQYPGDYLTAMERAVSEALEFAQSKAGFDISQLVGIGVDSTGSSPLPVDASNRALASYDKWRENLNAQCWLWKDHTGWREAMSITEMAAKHRPRFIAKCGSTYSSEWWWAKIWRCLTVAPDVFDAAFSWVELADWIPSLLAGIDDPRAIKRGVCAAGHKALYAAEWGGLPDKEFLAMLDPNLGALRDRLYEKAYDATESAGRLCHYWAGRFGLVAGIPIAMGAFDVHYGAIGCGVAEGTLVKAIGTSTCDCCVVSPDHLVADIPGICGIVKGSILPGYYGVEAGQSAVGDLFKWWVEFICGDGAMAHSKLTEEASRLRPGQSGVLALDWNNGNRTILVDQLLSGLIVGQTLYTTRAEVYRALIEATAFGARVIIERLREYGVKLDRVVCAGGIAEKNPLLMQIYADVTGCSMQVTESTQACALGSAVVAAVLAGAHNGFVAAQAAMTSVKDTQFVPDQARHAVYDKLYELYRDLHDSFGGVSRSADLSHVMKRLIEIKYEDHPASF